MSTIQNLKHTLANYTTLIIPLYLLLLLPQLVLANNQNAETPLISVKDENFVDSTLIDLNIQYQKAIETKDTLARIRALGKMSDRHLSQMNYREALSGMTEALYYANEANLNKEKAKNLSRLGKFYNRYHKYYISRSYFTKADAIIRDCIDKGDFQKSDLISNYIGLIEATKNLNKNTEALQYVDSCYSILNNINAPKHKYTNVIRIQASILSNMDSTETALKLLLPIAAHNDSLIQLAQTPYYIASDHILVLSNIARVYLAQEKYDLALQYYKRSLKLIQSTNKKPDHQVHLFTQVAKIYQHQGKHQRAYSSLMQAYKYTEENLRTSSRRNKKVLTIQNSYIEKLEQKEKELIVKELEISKRDEAILRIRIILLIVLVLVISATLLIWNKVQRNKHKNAQALSQKEAQQAREQLEYKNKELTTYTLRLMEHQDLLKQYDSYLTNDHNKEAKSLRASQKQITLNTWEEFEKRFVAVNKGFYKELKNRFPDLTLSDLKYCALLKLNLSGKEISKLTGVSPKSVHMASYRLRKKINIDSDKNLVEFLNAL